MSTHQRIETLILSIFVGVLFIGTAVSQTTDFTYQGHLDLSGQPANANYDFEFKLYDAASGGSLLGALTRSSVQVANGAFTVQLDFAPSLFNGTDRYLEIAVRPAGSGSYQQLLPRKRVSSAPYAFRSIVASNALQLGGVNANQYVVTTDPRMSDARNPISGSGDYVQNRTTSQAATNFNISGNGVAGGSMSGEILRAYSHLVIGGIGSIGGQRVLSIGGSSNIFAGASAGTANTTGIQNAFFGSSAGNANTSGQSNSFFGAFAGDANTIGDSNSFFGTGAGDSNTGGNRNSFFGRGAGGANTVADDNSFFGASAGAGSTGLGICCNSFFGAFAGESNGNNHNSFFGYRSGRVTDGYDNSFFGSESGLANTSGILNSFFGRRAGAANTEGSDNSFFGSFAGDANTTGGNNAFFGRSAGGSNTIAYYNSFFGSSAGAANTTGSENSFFGASAGAVNTTGDDNSFFGRNAGLTNSTGNSNSIFGAFAGSSNTNGSSNSFFGASAGLENTIGAENSFFGLNSGVANTTGDDNSFFGVGSGSTNTTGFFNTFVGRAAGNSNTTGSNNTVIGRGADVSAGGLSFATAIGANAVVMSNNTIQLGRTDGSDMVNIDGPLNLDLGFAGTTTLCANASGIVSFCSSSARYKSDIRPFSNGMALLRRLRPVTFNWKEAETADVGLIAEEVAKVEPLLVTHNKTGEIEGVKYDGIAVVLVNAVKQQQAQIDELVRQVAAQKLEQQTLKAQISSLRRRLCRSNPRDELCRRR